MVHIDSEANAHFPCITTDPLAQQRQVANLQLEISRAQTLPQMPEINSSAPAGILQLPPEILSEIFATCLSSNISNERSRHCMSPLIFGKVCRSWREIAWSVPILWTLLQVDLNKVTDFHAILANEWLLRSKGRPLALSVAWEWQGSKPFSENACITIMGAIARYSHQWQEIEFQLPYFCLDILDCVQNHLPILRFINISIYSQGGMEYFGGERRMFSAAPQLRVVLIGGTYLDTILLPMGQLTSLSICCGDVDQCLEMLQQSPQVIHCAFQNICISNGVPSPVHVHASQLEVLEFMYLNPTTLLPMLLLSTSRPQLFAKFPGMPAV